MNECRRRCTCTEGAPAVTSQEKTAVTSQEKTNDGRPRLHGRPDIRLFRPRRAFSATWRSSAAAAVSRAFPIARASCRCRCAEARVRRFGLSRVRLREQAHAGFLPGLRKSSW
ncbi:hypothetical protein [Streptomyces sp. MUM 178J]|uniref:hypothetical protein n=1 Tax=Streptomyces sp. MUM 178J TaxID=2791991 RepID=UPI0023D91278|nr:hypothetical protein [Streptomyces sp. MUM 178J]WRQ82147.1 hypothetical protein I3F59_023875 [Streptomyces sp. MUM 178J]